jgi:hypothetical protein
MKTYFLLIILIVGVTIVIVWAQTPPVDEYKDMVNESDVILVAQIKSISQVVHKNKLFPPGDSLTLPNPNEYVIGREFRIEVSDWVKGKSKNGKNKEIRILVFGRVPLDGAPILVKDTQYLLFLKRASIEKPFEDAVVATPDGPGAVKLTEFNIDNYYYVTGGLAGAITGEKKIKEVRRKIKE